MREAADRIANMNTHILALQKEIENLHMDIHQFRHLNASLLIYNGEDVRAVSAALGHSQTSTTLNIYAHTFETAQARACDALADALPVKFGKKQA